MRTIGIRVEPRLFFLPPCTHAGPQQATPRKKLSATYGRHTIPPRYVTNNFFQYGVCGEFGWVGFLVVCFLYKINPHPHEKLFAVGEKVAQMQLFNLFFLGLGWPWVGGVRRFHNNI